MPFTCVVLLQNALRLVGAQVYKPSLTLQHITAHAMHYLCLKASIACDTNQARVCDRHVCTVLPAQGIQISGYMYNLVHAGAYQCA